MTNTLYRGVPTWDSLFLSLIILKFKGEKFMKKKYYPVFSTKLCNVLLRNGCRLDHVDANANNSGQVVFYFDKTDELEDYVDYYTLQSRIAAVQDNINNTLNKF